MMKAVNMLFVLLKLDSLLEARVTRERSQYVCACACLVLAVEKFKVSFF